MTTIEAFKMFLVRDHGWSTVDAIKFGDSIKRVWEQTGVQPNCFEKKHFMVAASPFLRKEVKGVMGGTTVDIKAVSEYWLTFENAINHSIFTDFS